MSVSKFTIPVVFARRDDSLRHSVARESNAKRLKGACRCHPTHSVIELLRQSNISLREETDPRSPV